MKKFSSWFMGNQPGRQQKQTQSGRPKKNVHWKSAERPSPPGRPILIPLSDQQPDVVTLKWERPKIDGGSPITSYIIEHRRMGSPHWVRSTPTPVTGCEVSISGLEPGWRYQFRAIAENVVGKSDPSELSDPLTVTLQRNAISVPRFASELTDMSVVENERVEFRVSVLGQPQPEISWFKDGYEIFSSRRTKIVNDNDASVLIIHQVALTDEGEIKCTATNRAGHVVTKAKLMVEAPPKIRLPRNYEDGLIVEADEVLRLKVGIAGQPAPSVVWLHEGEFITNGGRHELVTTDKNSSLKIDNVKRIDRGEYSIKAVNKLGEDATSFLVTVTSRPDTPGKVRLNTSYGKSVTLSWTAPEDDGGCKIGNYIVEYFRIGWNVWLKAATTRQLSTTLNDLIEGSEYKFRVKAENPYGLSDPGEESDVLFVPDPKRGLNSPDGDDSRKPVPPRRKTLSPQRAVPDGEEQSGDTSPRQPSPLLNRKTKPQILDNEDLHREMSYGTNLTESRRSPPSPIKMDVPGGNLTRRSPSPRVPDGDEEIQVAPALPRKVISRPTLPPLSLPSSEPSRPISPSVFPLKPVTTMNSPSIAPALSPVLTSALAPILRFAPATPTLPTPLPTPPSPRTLSPSTKTPMQTKATESSNKSLQKQANPQKILEPAKQQEEISRQSNPQQTVEPIKKQAESPKETQAQSRVRSVSPPGQAVRRTPPETVQAPLKTSKTPPETPPELKKTSQALQRSEEPSNLDVNQRVQRFSDQPFSTSERRSSQNGVVANPTIEISAPASDPAGSEPHPLSETEKLDEVHTSNEFMLVVFQKNSKVKDTEKQDSFDLDLEEALQPPPISISSPDLASLEFSNLHTFPLRRSVSSTELLYERAMARFYEAVEMEEAEKAKKLKIAQEKLTVQPTQVRKRLGSMSEAERQSFERRSQRRRQSADIAEIVNKSKWDSSDSLASKKGLLRTRGMLNQISHDTDDGSEYLDHPRAFQKQISQETDEGSDYQDQRPRRMHKQISQETDEGSDYHDHERTGASFDVESDYTASTESVSEDSIEKFKRELVARTRSASTELETYHPRSMSAGVFTPYRAPTPEQSVVVLNRPMPLASPDFVPKPILKRPSNESVGTDEPASPTSVVPPSSPPPMSPNMPTSPINEKPDKSKGFKSFFKWDKKTPTEKNTEANAEPPPTTRPQLKSETSVETKRRIKEEEERAKLEAERIFQEEAKVVADHYGDIVRQVGSTKKYNPPLYLNRDELKKAAEKAERESNTENYNPTHGKSRLSLIERHQTQHVTQSPSRMHMKDKEQQNAEEVFSEEEATPSSTSQLSQRSESRGRKKIVKVKKIIKKRIPSSTRSREASSTRPANAAEVPPDDARSRQVERPKITAPEPIKKSLPTTSTETKPTQPQTALVAVPQKSPDELSQEAEEKVRSALSYMTDVCLFIAACYVYLFKDARLVLPILALMVYRQLGEVIRNSIPDWMKKKRQ
ncbi:proteoglycan 4 [Eupeodes corollae]|uniref:proteoglycan 4 n=1 Tax=Eupeodes corollae TaxID=290404 RepID=UPI002493270B|nr:proteoglycan 4 [Eupeodes corollae]